MVIANFLVITDAYEIIVFMNMNYMHTFLFCKVSYTKECMNHERICRNKVS